MARRSRGDEEESVGNWLDTYADMVTLLMTFFVLLYAMSSPDAVKWQNMVEEFSRNGKQISEVIVSEPIESSKVDTEDTLPENFDELYEYLKKYVDDNSMGASVELVKQQNSVFIRFNDNIFFNPDNYVLKSESYPMLDFMGDCLKSVEEEILVICVNGHTADVNIQNYPVSARRLSSQRADSVAIYFEDEKQIISSKIVARGYASNFPIATNETKEGQKKNRRVDITIVNNKGSMSDVDDLYNLVNGAVDIDSELDKRETADTLIPKQKIEDSVD